MSDLERERAIMDVLDAQLADSRPNREMLAETLGDVSDDFLIWLSSATMSLLGENAKRYGPETATLALYIEGVSLGRALERRL